jgi:hypothetical protein
MSKEPKSYKPKVAKPPELLEYCDWAGVIKLMGIIYMTTPEVES